jgi:hypothetical protein
VIRRRQAVAAVAAVHVRDARDLIRQAEGVPGERGEHGPERAATEQGTCEPESAGGTTVS